MQIASLALLINALIWGLSWIPFKWFAANEIHPLWATALMYGIASTLMLYRCKKQLTHAFKNSALLQLGLTSGLTNACFNTAITFGDVIRVVLLFYLMPIWAILLSRWLLKEKLNTISFIKIILGLSGAFIITGGHEYLSNTLPTEPADWLAVLGGFLFALNNVLLKRNAEIPSPLPTLGMICGTGFISLMLAIILTFFGQIKIAYVVNFSSIIMLIIWSLLFIIANSCLQYGASRLPAVLTAVLMLSEIFFGGFSAWILNESNLGTKELLGGFLIFLAAIWKMPQLHSDTK